MNAQTFVQRCRICGGEVSAPLGPEAFSETAYALAEHIQGHSDADVAAWVLRSHGRDVFEAAKGPSGTLTGASYTGEAERDALAAALQRVFAVLKDSQHTYGVIGDNGELLTPMMTESDALGEALGLADWRGTSSYDPLAAVSTPKEETK